MIQGNWYNKDSAAHSGAVLRLTDRHFTIETDSGLQFSGLIDDLVISDRLGNVERKLTLVDGSVFATRDNDSIDRLCKANKRIGGFAHAFESRISLVVIALVLTLLICFAFFTWGIPWTSTKIAQLLPHKTNELIAQQALDFLDDYIFEESQLDEERIEQITAHFNQQLIPLAGQNSEIKYRLHFRLWQDDEVGIPNAFALPSGDIILTDKFVELSQNQNEIDSVLLHEIGHVVKRHSLQRVVEGTLLTTIVMLATGDSSSLSDMGLGLGSLLASSHYSRGHETEADLFAFRHMLKANIDPQAFSTIMARMTNYMEISEESQPDNANSDQNQDHSLLDYLSSHPETAQRLRQATRFSECFNQGLVVCNGVLE